MNPFSAKKSRSTIGLALALVCTVLAAVCVGFHSAAHLGVLAGFAMSLLALNLMLSPIIMTAGGARLCNNSLGSLAGTMVLQRALRLVFQKFPPLAMISMGFKELDGKVQTANLNQSVTSRLVSIPTVGDFGDSPSDHDTTDVTLALTGFKQVYLRFTAQEYNSTDRDLIDETARPIAVAIARHIIASVAKLWTSRNYAGTLPVSANWGYANTIVALRNALVDLGVPEGAMFAIFKTAVYGSLLTDEMIVAFLKNQDNESAIRTGRLPRVSDLAIGEYPSLPSQNGTAKNVTIEADDDVVTSAAHGFVNGDRVTFPTLTGGTGLAAGATIYYVRDVTTNTFKVAATAGGAAINVTADATAGTVQLAENLIGFAGSPDSTAYVARAPKNPEELMPGVKFRGALGYVQDPVTGFQIMVNQWIGDDLSLNNRLLWLEGYGVGNANNGVRLISA